jgi:hypothetical protein
MEEGGYWSKKVFNRYEVLWVGAAWFVLGIVIPWLWRNCPC